MQQFSKFLKNFVRRITRNILNDLRFRIAKTLKQYSIVSLKRVTKVDQHKAKHFWGSSASYFKDPVNGTTVFFV